MKILRKNIALAVAAMATLSCAKEISHEQNAGNANLSPLTVVASYDGNDSQVATGAKASFTEDYPVIGWQSEDAISIMGKKTVNQKFVTASTGKRVTFEGLADLSDEMFYAVYPYDASVEVVLPEEGAENPAVLLRNVTIPAVQKAVAGSFDPKAYVAVASSSDKENFVFNSCVSFMKFQLGDYAADVESVVLVGNNNEGLAGTSERVMLGGYFTNNNTFSKTVTLSGTFETGKDYFMILRPLTLSKGLTLYIRYKDGSIKSCSSSGELIIERNHIKKLGVITDEKLKDSNDLYTLYNLGFDINVAGVTVNKTTYPDAVLLKSDGEADKEMKGVNQNCITFLEQNGDAGFKFGGNITVSGKVVLCGRYSDKKTIIKSGNYFFQANGGSLCLKNLDIDATGTSKFLLRNYNAKSPMDAVVIDGCKVGHLKGDIMKLGTAQNINVLRIHNSDFGFLESEKTYMIESNQTLTFEEFDLYNNVFYCEADENKVGTIFSNSNANQLATFNNIRIENNTFVGLYADPTTHYVMAKEVKKITQKNNYFHLPKYFEFAKGTDGDQKYLSIVKATENAPVESVDVNRAYVYYDTTLGTVNVLKAFFTSYEGMSLDASMSTYSNLDLATFHCSKEGYGAQR